MEARARLCAWRRCLADGLVDVAEHVANDRRPDPFGMRHHFSWTVLRVAVVLYAATAAWSEH